MFGGSAKFCPQNFAEWWGSSEQVGDSACSLRSQRNGGTRRRKQGEMGGEGKRSGNGTPHPAAHLPFFSPPLAVHHSAKRASVERNLPIYDVRFTGFLLTALTPLTAPHCGFALCVVPPHGPHTALLFVACVRAPHTAASPCAGLLGFCPFGTAQGKSPVKVLRLQSQV